MELDNNRFLILSGGSINSKFLAQYLNSNPFDKIICADGGLEAAHDLKLDVNYIVGDFDSVSNDVLKKYKESIYAGKCTTVLHEYNPEKDFTDTHIAIELAIKQNAGEIVLFGATGSRIDHMLANINLLMKPLSCGIQAYIMDEHNKVYLINKSTVLSREEAFGSYVSLLPLSEKVEGVNLVGFKYPLKNHLLTIGDSLGISNELQEEKGFIQFERGILIVVEARD